MAPERHQRFPRICILTESYYPVVGGGEKQAELLATDLAARGINVRIVTRRSDAELPENENLDGVVVRRISPVGSGPLRRWLMVLSSVRTLTSIRGEYDVILVSGFKALGLAGVLVGSLFGKVCILKADSNGEMSGDFFASGLKRLSISQTSLAFRVFLFVRNSILRRADHFVAITSGIADELECCGVKQHRVHCITNGVDTTRFRRPHGHEKRALRKRFGIPEDAVVITYAGRLVRYKGLPLLLKVVERLREDHGNLRLVLIGSGGLDIHNCEAELRAYVAAHGMESEVCFTGDTCDVHEYLQASDIFALPTEEDAFPLALIEAMACGLAVIATPVGGIPQIVTNDQSGIIVAVGDFQQLYDALRVLIKDTSRSVSLGQAAALTASSRYSREIIADRYVALFQRSRDPHETGVPAAAAHNAGQK